jgi:2-keto-4-pentenoate hydratase
LPDAASAYAVQQAVAQALGYAASRYWKSGGPSREAEPTHARLPHDGVVDSPADLRAFAFRLRGVEAEIALRLAAPVDAARAEGLSVEAARGLVDAMTVSIEIVDSRWSEALQAPALAKLADLQSHGALVLGAWKPLDTSRDWMRQACTVKVGDQAPQVFTGTHSMGDPAQVLPRWLRHATQGGRVVPAGTVVTTGTWCGILMAQAGDLVQVSFEGVGEASVQL